MKRYILRAAYAALAVLLTACVQDKGNYDYLTPDELQPVEISGIEERYNTTILQPCRITPTVKVPDEEDYEYCWYMYSTAAQRRDTVGMEKALDFVVTQPSGEYQLVLQVKNIHTGVCSWKKSRMIVASEFSRGWYVTKDNGGVTDLDWIKPDGTVVPNVLAMTNGEGVPGRPNRTTFLGSRYNFDVRNEDGTTTLVTNQGVFFVMSQSDMRIYHQEDLRLIRTFDDAFVYEPEVAAPQNLYVSTFFGAWLVNDGRVSSLSLFTSPSYGRFGYPKMGEYRASRYIMPEILGQNFVIFDELTSSFMYGRVGGGSMTRFNRDETLVTPYQPAKEGADMDCDLIFMQYRPTSVFTANDGFGLMKQKNTENYYSFVMRADAAADGTKLFREFNAVPEGCGVGKGKVFSPHNNNSTLYYSTGDNVLKSYNMSNHSEADLFTFPQGEQVAFISHIAYEDWSSPADGVVGLAVVTNDDTRWHLYLFDFVGQTAEIVTENGKYRSWSGNGRAAAAIYRGTGSDTIN